MPYFFIRYPICLCVSPSSRAAIKMHLASRGKGVSANQLYKTVTVVKKKVFSSFRAKHRPRKHEQRNMKAMFASMPDSAFI